MGKKLGILVLTAPNDSDIEFMEGLIGAAKELGIEVEVFLMADGVDYLGGGHLVELVGKGAKVSFCGMNAMERGIEVDPPSRAIVEEGSQFTLACIVESAERIIALV